MRYFTVNIEVVAPLALADDYSASYTLENVSLSPFCNLASYLVLSVSVADMNSFVNDENVSPKVIVGTNTNGTVKSFVFGEDIQNIGCGSCFTSPIAKTIQRGHDETDPDVAKRRKHNPWTKEVNSASSSCLFA